MRARALITVSMLVTAVAPAVELPVVPLSAIRDTTPPQITTPATNVAPKVQPAPAETPAPPAPASASRPDAARALKVVSGVNEIVDVALGHLNRIVTPFAAPEVYTASQAKTKVVGNVVYVGTDKAAPVGLYITDRGEDGAEAISLTLVPRRIPPRELRVQIQSYPNGGDSRARRWEESQPYVETIRNLFRAIALGERPAGYELRERPTSRWTPPCEAPGGIQGLSFSFAKGQSALGHHFEVAIGVVKNATGGPIELDETWCADHDIAAVAFWPRNLLEPGQTTEVYVAKRHEPGARGRERRSLVDRGD